MILCHIPSIKGGAWNEYTSELDHNSPDELMSIIPDVALVLKHNRATEIATENDLPIIGLAQAVSLYHAFATTSSI